MVVAEVPDNQAMKKNVLFAGGSLPVLSIESTKYKFVRKCSFG